MSREHNHRRVNDALYLMADSSWNGAPALAALVLDMARGMPGG